MKVSHYQVRPIEVQDDDCQWFEIYENGNYLVKILAGRSGSEWEATDSEIVQDYLNQQNG